MNLTEYHMAYGTNRNIARTILTWWIITLLLISGGITVYTIIERKVALDERAEELRKEWRRYTRYELQLKLTDIVNLIHFEYTLLKERETSVVKHRENSDVKCSEVFSVAGNKNNLGSEEETIKRRLLRRLSRERFGRDNNNFVFVIDETGKIIMYPAIEARKKLPKSNNLFDIVDIRGPRPFVQLVRKIKSKGYANVTYKLYNTEKKAFFTYIVYAKKFEPWNWIVCVESDQSHIEEIIENNKKALKASILKEILYIGIWSVILTFIAIFFSYHFSSVLQKEISILLNYFRDSTDNPDAPIISENNFDYAEFKFIAASAVKMVQKIKSLLKEIEEAAVRSELTSQAKTGFIANISHEIRKPINGILGMVDFLLSTSLSEEQKQYAESIRASVESIVFLLNDIKDFSAIEHKELELKKAPFDLFELGNESISFISRHVLNKNVKLDFSFDEQTPVFLIGDAEKLRQVLINLMKNSLTFTNKGFIKLAIKGNKLTNGKARVRFSIQDTGVGISEEKMHDLFDFTYTTIFKYDSSSKKFASIGLSLSVCKKMINLMGGELSIESVKEVGTTASFELDFDLAKQSDIVKLKAPSGIIDIAGERDDRFKGIKVLLVDDDPVSQIVAQKYLERFKCSVEIANNGREALDKVKTNFYNIIFMDCEMPEMDGFTTAKAIRKLEGTEKHTPIIAITANAMKGDRTMSLQSGMDEHIPKPIAPEVLEYILTKFVIEKNKES